MPAAATPSNAEGNEHSPLLAAERGQQQQQQLGGSGPVSTFSHRRPERTVMSILQQLFANKVYLYLVAAIASLYFTVTGVQYWGTSYLTLQLGAPPSLVNVLFILCASTGPTSGVVFGGWAADAVGGYKGVHQRVIALELCTLFGK